MCEAGRLGRPDGDGGYALMGAAGAAPPRSGRAVERSARKSCLMGVQIADKAIDAGFRRSGCGAEAAASLHGAGWW